MVDGLVEVFRHETVPEDLAAAFAAKLWDARAETVRYEYFRITRGASSPGVRSTNCRGAISCATANG